MTTRAEKIAPVEALAIEDGVEAIFQRRAAVSWCVKNSWPAKPGSRNAAVDARSWKIRPHFIKAVAPLITLSHGRRAGSFCWCRRGSGRGALVGVKLILEELVGDQLALLVFRIIAFETGETLQRVGGEPGERFVLWGVRSYIRSFWPWFLPQPPPGESAGRQKSEERFPF